MVLNGEVHQIDALPWLGCREPFSSLSHLIGSAVFAGLAYDLIQRGRGDRIRTVSLAVFAITAVLLLLLSGIYHSFWPGPIRNVMFLIDVSAVFALIAASMTPVHAILFRGPSRWGALAFVWIISLCGILWRWYSGTNSLGRTGIVIFLLYGWGCGSTAIALWRRFGWGFVRPAVLSGLTYTAGAIGLVLHRPLLVPGWIGPHEVWHVAVLTGIGLQWRFVAQFADGYVPLKKRSERLSVNHEAEPVVTDEL